MGVCLRPIWRDEMHRIADNSQLPFGRAPRDPLSVGLNRSQDGRCKFAMLGPATRPRIATGPKHSSIQLESSMQQLAPPPFLLHVHPCPQTAPVCPADEPAGPSKVVSWERPCGRRHVFCANSACHASPALGRLLRLFWKYRGLFQQYEKLGADPFSLSLLVSRWKSKSIHSRPACAACHAAHLPLERPC
jgi:hypothetical protein